MSSQLTLDQAKAVVRTKEHYYKAMLRNHWYLPNLKSSIVTEEYMADVREKKTWCPTYD